MTLRGACDAASQLVVVWFWATLLGTFYCAVYIVLPILFQRSARSCTPDFRMGMSPRFCSVLILIRYLISLLSWSSRIVLSFIFVAVLYCLIVLPVLYGHESLAAFLLSVVAVVILLEILVNWLCVRFVTSSYRPEVDRRSRDRRWSMKNGGDVVGGCQDVDDDDDESGFEIDLAQLRASKPEVGGNGVSDTTPNGISGSVYSLPVSGVRSLGAAGGADRAWRRGDTIYVVSGRGDDGTRVFDPAAARWNGGPHVGCRKVVYPYWSSKPCAECRHRRPPRAHHCRHCGSCVLKRDHHCLLVGRCVGLRNQRHFIVFVFWSTVAIALSLSHAVVYAWTSFIPRNSFWDLLLPVTGVRLLVGVLSLLDALMVVILYSLGWFLVTSVCLGWFLRVAGLVLRLLSAARLVPRCVSVARLVPRRLRVSRLVPRRLSVPRLVPTCGWAGSSSS